MNARTRSGELRRHTYGLGHPKAGKLGRSRSASDYPVPTTRNVVLLFPITSREPLPSRFAAEIPATEKRRAGLSIDMRLWLVLDEYNQDILGQSFYLEPEPPLGQLSKAFLLPLLKAFIARRAETKRVLRNP